ncbi:MAG: hypothetical protein IPN67_21460 [Bacteroidales bacterium]|nr:hypothetical protein [Bacteroidales bacterium]
MIILYLTAVISCNEKRGVRNAENTSGTNIISIAQRIAIERYSGYTKVTIKNPWQGADNINMVYYLVKRGSELPPEIDSSSVIRVPVVKIVCMSTTHIAMISALGKGNPLQACQVQDLCTHLSCDQWPMPD